jgi:hypothetical protein
MLTVLLIIIFLLVVVPTGIMIYRGVTGRY